MWAYAAGGLCLIYFLGILASGGVGSNFYLIWAVMAAFFLSYGYCSGKGILERLIPVFIRRSFAVCFLLGMVLLVIAEGLVISGFVTRERAGLDYIIVLGAQVREDGPSKVLAMRLEKACEYLAENEHTVVIVSGGQGSNEPETEAACMSRYLRERGIAPERILEEDASVNTLENLVFSRTLIEAHDREKGKEQIPSVGIVTNNFHIFRSTSIARKQGYADVTGISAPSYLLMQPNNMLREFFGIMKDYLSGNML